MPKFGTWAHSRLTDVVPLNFQPWDAEYRSTVLRAAGVLPMTFGQESTPLLNRTVLLYSYPAVESTGVLPSFGGKYSKYPFPAVESTQYFPPLEGSTLNTIQAQLLFKNAKN